MTNKTDVLSEGTLQWYEQKLHEFQDWLLDKAMYAETKVEKSAYKQVLHMTIDMFCGVGVDYVKIAEEIDEWM